MKGDYNFLPKGLRSKEGWYDRGYLPHLDAGETPQFITFRLFDSMPRELLEKWRKIITGEKREAAFRKMMERFLDSGYGTVTYAYLKFPRWFATVCFFMLGPNMK